jgi:predicted XRE-type DNA-binding protein
METSVEAGSENVYADLRYARSEAMLVKAKLVTEIADLIRQRGLTQEQAAKLLRLTQPKISGLLKGRFRGISEQRLLECLTHLGKDVQIVIGPAPRHRNGRMTVRFA